MDKPIKITNRMISAGLKRLRESHALGIELSSDHLLVREILEAALRWHTCAAKSSEKNRREV